MAGEVDSLILEASVVDNFSRTLNELSKELAELEAQEEVVDPIRIDANTAKAIVKVEALEAALDDLDRKDIDIHTDVDTDAMRAQATTQRIARRGQRVLARDPDMPGPNLTGATDMDIDDRARAAIRRTRGRGGYGEFAETVAEAMTPGLPGEPDVGEGRSRLRRAVNEFEDMKLSMGFLMNIFANLVPLLGVFIGALPAAIAGLGALAAAAFATAGALIAIPALGLGAMAFQGGELNVQELQEHVRALLDSTLEAFTPLMEALQPLAVDMFRSLERLVRTLASDMQVALSITDELRGAFDWIAQTIGPLVQDTIQFAEAMWPVMSFIVGGISDIDWFTMFTEIIADTLPLLTQFSALMLKILSGIYDMSLGFFQMANAVLAPLALFMWFIEVVPMLGQALGVFISVVLMAVSATGLLSIATSALMGRIYGLASAIFIASSEVLTKWIAAMTGYTISTWTAYAATAALLGVLTFGLAPVLGTLSARFMGVNNQLSTMSGHMDKISRESRRVGNFGGGFSGGVAQAGGSGSYKSVGSTTIIAPDKETGNAAAHTNSWIAGGSATTDKKNVESRHHSDG